MVNRSANRRPQRPSEPQDARQARQEARDARQTGQPPGPGPRPQRPLHEELVAQAEQEPPSAGNELDPEELVVEHNGRAAKRYPAMWLVYLDGQMPKEELVLLDVHGDLPTTLDGQIFWHGKAIEEEQP